MTDLDDREWRLIREDTRSGPLNMALDEVAAETAADGGPRTLRVYRWEPATLSLGYHQEPETVDWDFCEREGISVTRRPTGGGGIYHDTRGDISYSIVAPADELPGDLMETYELLCEPLFDALERVGVEAGFVNEERPAIFEPACYLRGLHPAHDVVAGDGRKLSGNAQYRRRDSVIQHGSVLFSDAVETHLDCFVDSPNPETFRERVTNLREQRDLERERAVEAFEAALGKWADADVGEWTDDELALARARVEEKYDSPAWNRDRVDPTA
ncbi:biotin/lipoate A/B protein ligase family protein [Halococcus sp. IIIV-5B]|uniref:lipoate--protein ligase family protein n=1 Tax=Halococcus sp. IIIV-5B TaxID=2321230 RepID=UPI000E7588B0|nr:biotin/lipoate A/B protein ligase family protein [Halococcus sp. IIIV-5B]RJS98268.1 lipoate--protein ligase family protein [Halococcus sp. IIIV-5B]